MSDESTEQYVNDWLIASRDAAIVNHESLTEIQRPFPGKRILWTDDFSNLFSVLK